jgi:hypothetical protein
MSATGPSNGGSDTADERKQKTYSQQLKDIQKKKKIQPPDNTGADEGFFLAERQRKEKLKKQKEEAEKSFREMRGGGNQVVQSPTTSEVSQVTQTEVTTPEVEKPEEKEDDITIRKRRIKAKGRSPTILTGVTGVTGGLTLGKPSLLGR